MRALLVAVQDRLADLLIAVFTAVNRRVDLVAFVLRWFCGPADALEPV